jgi:crotonobetainyl-CoA:carnitine CoA-transferase CaiB-like acyl-CoA transferase
MMQPLAGRLVLDFTTLLPGPLATLMLAEAGAEVIKIERPGGEDMRGFPPFVEGQSVPFALLNRGKASHVADLKNGEDRARLMPLIERADVLVEQFRPGVMARLGFGYETLAAINPRLVYCSITGYGQTGPKAGIVGHDLNYVAETGLLALSHGSAAAPVLPPAQIADIAGGTFPAVINILLALMAADRTGQGRHLDIAMCDAMFTFAVFAQAQGQGGVGVPANGQGFLAGGLARYNLYRAADGRLVAIGALEPKFWATVCDVLALPAEARDDMRDPIGVKAAVAAAISRETSAIWAARFTGLDACVSVVATLEEAMRDPHVRARGLFAPQVEVGSTTLPAAVVPIDTSLRDGTAVKAAPTLSHANS